MVVRVPKVDGADQTSMDSQCSSTTPRSEEEEEEDSSGGSDMHPIPDTTQRKRKATEGDEDVEVKRLKNREAAKRCRDKKQKQTEDLKHTNGELEKENCQLSKQRDELIRKCKEYQREIEQHKQHGCALPLFNPPYNLDHLLQPSSPPSPSFSESAPSTSSCPSPAPSISPGPSSRYPPSARNDGSQDGMASGDLNRSNARTSLPTSTSPGMTQVTPDSKHIYQLRVRKKDGNHKILCLDRENYIKVMNNLKAHRAAAAAKASQPESMPAGTSMSTFTVNSQSQQVPFPQEREPRSSMNTDMIQFPSLPSQVEEQEANHKSEQKLDTCEDLISILKKHVKDTGNGFQLRAVSEDEVPIKQELLDTEYEQNGFLHHDRQTALTGIKQENMMSESFRTWTSTGEQIRTGLDTLTNQDDPSGHIQSIVQFLERDEQTVPVTVNDANTVHQPIQTVRPNMTAQIPSERSAEMMSYVTSSAPMAALNKKNVGSNHTSRVFQQSTRQQVSSLVTAQRQNAVEDTSRKQQKPVILPMHNVKLRPSTANLVTLSNIPLASQGTGQEGVTLTTVQTNRTNVTSSSSMTAGVRLQPVTTNTSLSAGSMETPREASHSRRMVMMPGQPLGTTPSVPALQQDSVIPFQHPASSTIDPSAIAALHLPAAASTDNLMSESTSQIAEYLKANSIEMFES